MDDWTESRGRERMTMSKKKRIDMGERSGVWGEKIKQGGRRVEGEREYDSKETYVKIERWWDKIEKWEKKGTG